LTLDDLVKALSKLASLAIDKSLSRLHSSGMPRMETDITRMMLEAKPAQGAGNDP
jgi:hypothetical protein